MTSQMMVIAVMMYPESFYYFGHFSTATAAVSHSARHSDLIVCAVVPAAVVLGRCDIIVGAAARDAHDSSQCRRRRKTDGRTRGWARLSHFAEFTKSKRMELSLGTEISIIFIREVYSTYAGRQKLG